MDKKEINLNKPNIFKRFFRFLKKKWNSLLYWLMFKNYTCTTCFGKSEDCNCK